MYGLIQIKYLPTSVFVYDHSDTVMLQRIMWLSLYSRRDLVQTRPVKDFKGSFKKYKIKMGSLLSLLQPKYHYPYPTLQMVRLWSFYK